MLLGPEQRRLDDQPPETLVVGVEQGEPVGLQDSPAEARCSGQRPEERALFETLLATPLVDLGRAFDPENPNLFTWWAPWRNLRARNIGWRLDYVLVSPTVAQRATTCIVRADIGTSDHAPVVMTT